ncbi:MAG TPA: hypothetical protein VF323_08010 [Candidatus Limnocylindrales bacterium]
MNVPIRAATALLILTAAVVACGGTSSASAPGAQGQVSSPAQASTPARASAPASAAASAPTTTAIDACALITEQEATAFLGTDPGPGTDTGSATSPACSYGGSLTLGVEPTDGQAQYATTKAAMQGSGKAQELSGVGDAAYVFIVANTIADMEILKGTALLSVHVQGDPSRQNVTLATLTALGSKAVARL